MAQPVAAAPPTEPADAGPAAKLPSLGAGFTHPDNTSAHVALLVGTAGLIVAFLYWGGFKFAVDAGVTRP